MLVITGPGRCGTSLLARFCQELGCDTGGEWNQEVDAGLEHEQVVRINDILLGVIQGYYKPDNRMVSLAESVRMLFQSDFLIQKSERKREKIHQKVNSLLQNHSRDMAGISNQVIKDPRFTHHPEIIRAWHSVRGDLKVLLTYRSPEQILESSKRLSVVRPNHLHQSDVFRQDFANCIEAMLDLDIDFRILLFPYFLKQYDNVYQAFSELGLHFDREVGRQVWDRLVDLGKVTASPDFIETILPADENLGMW